MSASFLYKFLKYFSRALMLMLVMPVNNSVKGIVAKKLGDDTAEVEGRITLNPLAHLDPLGAIMIMLCGFGWSKPMNINYYRMRNVRKSVIILSLTDPVVHFISAIICEFFYKMITSLSFLQDKLDGVTPLSCLAIILMLLSQINVCLGVLHLLPLPPMDGFVIILQLSSKVKRWYYPNAARINQISTLILFALFFMPDITNNAIDPLGWLIGIVSSGLSLLTDWVPVVFG